MQSGGEGDFFKLPPELRLAIWKLTWTGRNVVVSRELVGTADADLRSLREFRPLRDFNTLRKMWIDTTDATFEDVERQFLSEIPTSVHDVLVRLHNSLEPRCESVARRLHNKYGGFETVGYDTITRNSLPSTEPVTLYICRESRAVTLEHYKLAFDLPGGESQLYFNFSLDTLSVDWHHPELAMSFKWLDTYALCHLSVPESTQVNVTSPPGWETEQASRTKLSVAVEEVRWHCPELKTLTFTRIDTCILPEETDYSIPTGTVCCSVYDDSDLLEWPPERYTRRTMTHDGLTFIWPDLISDFAPSPGSHPQPLHNAALEYIMEQVFHTFLPGNSPYYLAGTDRPYDDPQPRHTLPPSNPLQCDLETLGCFCLE